MDVNNNDAVNPAVVRQYVVDLVKRWREESDDVEREMDVSHYAPQTITQLEAIFITGNLRRDLPMEGSSGNNPQTTTHLLLRGEGCSEEAIDVFCGFLQETSCHLRSLHFQLVPSQQLRRLLEALHPNTSVKNLQMDCLDENDGALIEDLLRHKTDFTKLTFIQCHFSISDAFANLLSGLTHLKILELFYCHIDDEAVRVILQDRYPFITELNLSDNRIKSNGLGIMARRIPEALPNLEILKLDSNQELLNHPEDTRLFANNVLPVLKELHISYCAQEELEQR